MIKLLVKEVGDDLMRENLRRIQREFTEEQIILRGQWKFFEISIEGAVTNFKYPHKFNFVPKDIIQLSATGPGRFTIEWNYEEFDGTNLDITTGDSCVVRAFIGRYAEEAGVL